MVVSWEFNGGFMGFYGGLMGIYGGLKWDRSWDLFMGFTLW